MSLYRRRVMIDTKDSEVPPEGWDYFTIISLDVENRLYVAPPLIYDEDTGEEFYLHFLYSINGAEWEEYSGEYLILDIPKNSRVRFKAEDPGLGVYDTRFNFNCDQDFGIGGTIMSLFYGDYFNGKYIMPDRLPYGCVSFTIDDSGMSQEESQLSFIEDTKILLPATILSVGCYTGMFSNCTKLTIAPDLPATKLTNSCYTNMFAGCIRLRYIKMLAVDISAEYCLHYWVAGVALDGTFIKNKNAIWDKSGVDGVPNGWTIEYE